VQVTFNFSAAPAFALDNITTNSVVPEPSTVFLVLTSGIAGLFWRRRRA
jgi:hypothetical protein